jgi:hypothetical protein
MKRSELKQIIQEVIEESILHEEMSKASDVRDLILANPSMTAKEAAAKLGVSLNDASSAISRLRKSGQLPAITRKNAAGTKAPEKTQAKKAPAKTPAKTRGKKVPELDVLRKYKFQLFDNGIAVKADTPLHYERQNKRTLEWRPVTYRVLQDISLDYLIDKYKKIDNYEGISLYDTDEYSKLKNMYDEWVKFRQEFPDYDIGSGTNKPKTKTTAKKEPAPVVDNTPWKITRQIPDYEHSGDADAHTDYLQDELKDAGIDPKQFSWSWYEQEAERDYDDYDDDMDPDGYITISGKGKDLEAKVRKII